MEMKHPTDKERRECWKNRDKYFNCLNSHDLWLYNLKPKDYQEILELDPLNLKTGVGSGKCQTEFEGFKKSCLESWVKHFQMLRVKELQEKALKEKVSRDLKNRDSDPFWEKVQKSY